MKRYMIVTLAAGLLPLAGLAEEKPLWEVQVRLNGGKNESFHRWVKDLFTKDGSAEMIGDRAVFRVAGFENAATPEEDWVAEVRGLANPDAVMEEIQQEAKADGQGRFLIGEKDTSFLVWRGDDATLRFASPPSNADATVTRTAALEGDVWVSGWADLSRIARIEKFESAILNLPESVGFSASSAGTGMAIDVSVGLRNPESVEMGRAMLEGLRSELASDRKTASLVPPVDIRSAGNTLEVRIELTQAHLDDLIEEMKKAIDVR